MTPGTLADIANLVRRGESFDVCLRNFLDDFRALPSGELLQHEPGLLRDAVEQGELYDAYLAATAESLALEHNFPVPVWADNEKRKLRRPWFALVWPGMRAVLLLESPAPFRSRNLFVSANALNRA